MYVRMYVCMYALYKYTFFDIASYIYILFGIMLNIPSLRIYLCICTYIYMYMYAYIYVCVHVCVRACVRACLCTLQECIF